MGFAGLVAIELTDRVHRIGIAGPTAPRHAAHHIPQHCGPDDGVDSLAAVQHQAESSVDRLADPHAAAVVQGDQTHAAGRIAGKALGSHIGHDIAAVLDVGSLAKRRVGAADVVVVASQHDRTNFAVANHFIEPQRDANPPFGILIKNSRLRADHQFVFGRVANPDVIVAVLAAAFRIDALHRRLVGFV